MEYHYEVEVTVKRFIRMNNCFLTPSQPVNKEGGNNGNTRTSAAIW